MVVEEGATIVRIFIDASFIRVQPKRGISFIMKNAAPFCA